MVSKNYSYSKARKFFYSGVTVICTAGVWWGALPWGNRNEEEFSWVENGVLSLQNLASGVVTESTRLDKYEQSRVPVAAAQIINSGMCWKQPKSLVEWALPIRGRGMSTSWWQCIRCAGSKGWSFLTALLVSLTEQLFKLKEAKGDCEWFVSATVVSESSSELE